MTRLSRRAIASHVSKLLDDCHIEQPPIDLGRVARHLGLKITYRELPKTISGFLHRRSSGGAMIVVNSKHLSGRQRFTIAHEIGHFVLGHYENEIYVDKTYKVQFRSDAHEVSHPEEAQANTFAAALLMPKEMLAKDVRQRAHGHQIEDDVIDALMQRYRVSERALLIRLNTIGLGLTLPSE
jgi:Zn-dependent peptidase ImmA (M78 family)